MDKELKDDIVEILDIASNIDSENIDFGNAICSMIKMEILRFLFYISSFKEFDDKHIKFIQDYLDVEMTEQIKNKIYCFDKKEMEETVPNGLLCLINMSRENSTRIDIGNKYCQIYYRLGVLYANKFDDNESLNKTNGFVEKLRKYVGNAIISFDALSDEKNIETESEIRGLQKKATWLKCPNCGKFIMNNGYYCQECLEDFDEMIFNDDNYVDTSGIPKYVDIYTLDESMYSKYYYTSEKAGVVLGYSSSTGEEYIEDTFEVIDDDIITQDKIWGDTYVKFGDYLYKKNTLYLGNIPEGQYFEAYCSFNDNVRPIWFFIDGSVKIFSGEGTDDVVDFEGKYIRDEELLRVDMVNKQNGQKLTRMYIVVNGRLCSDAYANERGIKKINALKEKNISLLMNSSGIATITSKEFFENYPCPYCNARRCFNNTGWEHKAFGSILVYGRCSKCNNLFTECGKPEEIKKIAYNGSEENICYHSTAGAVRYLDSPCPYCGSYQVRYAKWRDKQLSTAFWGFFSTKLHCHYKCEKCGKMWE